MQCQNCGLTNTDGARFCKQCGQPLPAPPARPPANPPGPVPVPQPGNLPAYPQSMPPAYTPGPGPAPQPGNPPSYPQGSTPVYMPPPSSFPQAPQQPGLSSASAWNSPVAQPYAPISSMRRVSKITPRSAFRIAAAIYGLIYAVFGLIGFIGAVLSILVAGDFGFMGVGGGFASILIALLVFVFGILLVALLAGASAAITAWIYNLVAGRVGGIEVEVV